MKALIMKEFRLATHPTNFIFLSLSAMLMIPGYPYGIAFFYTVLGIFFICITGRENHDIEYSLMLPIAKSGIVKARIGYAVIIETVQLLLAVPFALIRRNISPVYNEVGMDANLALFGLMFLMFGIFNWVFFTGYYRNPAKVGRPFVLAGTLIMLYIAAEETLTHVMPFFRDVLDTPDPQHLLAKLLTLATGMIAFALLSLSAVRLSVKRFEKLDL